MGDEELLHGGVANAGAVLRSGSSVLRPSNEHSRSILAFLSRLEAMAAGGEFVRRHAEAGEPGFVKMWNEMGGMERFDRRRRWWAERKPDFEAALR